LWMTCWRCPIINWLLWWKRSSRWNAVSIRIRSSWLGMRIAAWRGS
jgi:hypothetical protein